MKPLVVYSVTCHEIFVENSQRIRNTCRFVHILLIGDDQHGQIVFYTELINLLMKILRWTLNRRATKA